ncbi:hypothetical protein HMPREF9396_0716 [Streptococcus sanguinis SK1059]|nr:hypothetical protein HMPREF9396_0716 [Streptococcus sanguinis SK1059]EGQ20781.1 hypothetical protein HMPREF8573_0709 [Streptococcus sanguinis ATCC 29667]EGQ24561.1 hypothetical protein HMPREF9387_1265 [Streptococcus sanguinis SK340]
MDEIIITPSLQQLNWSTLNIKRSENHKLKKQKFESLRKKFAL